ncbi:MAG: SMC-Scp complex subunit ScpB [Candidatus Paceibacterota bacterium]
MENSEKERAEEFELLKKTEAALFLAARWLNMDELVKLTSINPITLAEILQKLEGKYDLSSSAITLLKSDIEGVKSWKMDVQQDYAYMTNCLATGEAEFTKAEQETLAVVAYKQPIKQSVVIKIRGNKAYDHIKHFTQSGLVTSRRAGRTFELNLSETFYNYFNLKK